MYIDGTLIINKSGIECIRYGGETIKKNLHRSAICNKNTKCIEIFVNKSTNNNKIKTLPHDST